MALSIASLYHPCFALGLEEAEVTGRLGQPLDVNVPLHVSEHEARYVDARLVRVRTPVDTISDEATLSGNYRTQVVADRRGRLIVQVTSRKGVLEPYVEFTVEVISNATRVQREYTVMIDPPGMDLPLGKPSTMVASAPEVVETLAPPATMVASVGNVALHDPVPAAPQPAPQPRRAAPVVQVAIREDEPGVHVVHRGDSLYGIARTFARQHHLTQAQAVARLYQGNPGAFRGSPDLMLAGARISLDALDASGGMLASAQPAPPPVVATPPTVVPVVARAIPASAGATQVAQAAPVGFTPASVPAAPPAAERPAFSFDLLGSAEAAPAPAFGINTLKLDEHLHLTSLFTVAPPTRTHRAGGLPDGMLWSAVRAVCVTALMWFGGLALLRRRQEARAQR